VKYTSTCAKCGVTKEQIFTASNKRAKQIKKQRTGEKLFKTRHRPDDVMFTTMAILVIFLGLFGAHHFYVGRKLRGWIQIVFINVGFWVFAFTWKSSIRATFDDWGMPFPTDWLAVIAVLLWIFDAFAVVFGMYRYPIRLGDAKTGEAKK